jgi:hypothetical protein
MQIESYKGYVGGHAIREQQNILERERYAASGTVTRSGKFVEASGFWAFFNRKRKPKNAD